MTAATRVRVAPGAAPAAAYDVVVGAGILEDLPALVRDAAPATRYAVIADAAVADLHADTVLKALREDGLAADVLTFPAGEASKTRSTWVALTDGMLELGVGRDGCIIALGGGVTGDVAGFVAATYMRGIPVVQVPTTLLAMVDASVGGKTAVDVPHGKNLVGAFHQPRLVVADTDVLSTLPVPALRAGCAEALKHGAIADATYLDRLARHAPGILDGSAPLHDLVTRSVQIKAEFVSRDEREAGARAALNFGHTLGHALELVSQWTLQHGQAVALGMVLEAALGEAIGITEAGTSNMLKEACAAFGLPGTVSPGLDTSAVLNTTRLDKKARHAEVRYTLLTRPGAVARTGDGRWTHAVHEEAVLDVLAGAVEGLETAE